MKAYSLKKAKEIAVAFNRLHSGEQVAAELKLPVSDVRKIIKWLDDYDPCNRERAEDESHCRLAFPTSKIWIVWLYEHGISPLTAAACVCWPYSRVLTSCGGKEEWLKSSGRAPFAKPRAAPRDVQERLPDDPTPEEIAAMVAKLPKRVEGTQAPDRSQMKQYVYNHRKMSFK